MAPKRLLMPPLDLQAAVMAVRFKEKIVKEHEITLFGCSFWPVSTIGLQWIHSSHLKGQICVANQVAEILDATDVSL